MKKLTILLFLLILAGHFFAQDQEQNEKKERLDFAKMYFEIGGTVMPSFQGKMIENNEIKSFNNSASAVQYLNWGGFHFWGHGEFYVTFPMNYTPFNKNEDAYSEIFNSVVTGFRYYPWVYRDKKVIPYIGANWSALEFQQKIRGNDDHPAIAKDFILAGDAGILYGFKGFSLRLGATYFPNNKWDYPISKTQKAVIKVPNYGFQLGLLYAWDSSKNTKQENIDKWNSYPHVSKQSLGSNTFGNFFIGAGPSISFSLKKSDYNKSELPYLQDKIASSNYFDLAAGYNFNKAGLFTALSFRKPKFKTEGFGTTQTIKKTSITLEVNKFLVDYSGFVPYIGLNIAYDKITYQIEAESVNREISLNGKIEPGITLGWDIQPGKNQEALILRTNLRWYPLSSFEIDSKKFNFSQLEYNLIQIVFYPERIKRKR